MKSSSILACLFTLPWLFLAASNIWYCIFLNAAFQYQRTCIPGSVDGTKRCLPREKLPASSAVSPEGSDDQAVDAKHAVQADREPGSVATESSAVEGVTSSHAAVVVSDIKSKTEDPPLSIPALRPSVDTAAAIVRKEKDIESEPADKKAKIEKEAPARLKEEKLDQPPVLHPTRDPLPHGEEIPSKRTIFPKVTVDFPAVTSPPPVDKVVPPPKVVPVPEIKAIAPDYSGGYPIKKLYDKTPLGADEEWQ
ncbi:hypothetical protein X943_003400 [Babesia divergens]|uniref:Uncharacterized protein n=1 Tax=Babesia divergens TaxID=32595 RepID=A0AAD9G7M6_BABDI|nr:hypothetical protein X943_003400 [Babesia divergens]